MKLVLKDFRVLLLRGAAERITGIGEGLVAVEAADLERLAVELEALGGELGGAEAEVLGDAVVAQRQLEIAIDWGRYAELIDYDDRDEILSLDVSTASNVKTTEATA